MRRNLTSSPWMCSPIV